ncbi:MAG: YceD family protein [Cyanobacteria bacterium P01_F01_bin.86]
MNSIYIPHLLNATDRTRTLFFETSFKELATLTPVRAEISVRHGTTFLEVRGTAQTIVTLTCDRCLQHYNHRLSVDAKEIIWLEEHLNSADDDLIEQEISPEDLVESLSLYGYFDPETWIYEQVCLALPQRQICDTNCQGIVPKIQAARSETDLIDHRWSALVALKQQLATDEPQQN